MNRIIAHCSPFTRVNMSLNGQRFDVQYRPYAIGSQLPSAEDGATCPRFYEECIRYPDMHIKTPMWDRGYFLDIMWYKWRIIRPFNGQFIEHWFISNYAPDGGKVDDHALWYPIATKLVKVTPTTIGNCVTHVPAITELLIGDASVPKVTDEESYDVADSTYRTTILNLASSLSIPIDKLNDFVKECGIAPNMHKHLGDELPNQQAVCKTYSHTNPLMQLSRNLNTYTAAVVDVEDTIFKYYHNSDEYCGATSGMSDLIDWVIDSGGMATMNVIQYLSVHPLLLHDPIVRLATRPRIPAHFMSKFILNNSLCKVHSCTKTSGRRMHPFWNSPTINQCVDMLTIVIASSSIDSMSIRALGTRPPQFASVADGTITIMEHRLPFREWLRSQSCLDNDRTTGDLSLFDIHINVLLDNLTLTLNQVADVTITKTVDDLLIFEVAGHPELTLEVDLFVHTLIGPSLIWG